MCFHDRHRFILITSRTRSQGVSMEALGKFSSEYRDSVAVAYLNPIDIQELGLRDKIKIISGEGSIVLPIKEDHSLPRGVIFVPLGPWVNNIIPSKTSIGIPQFKSLEVYIEKTDENPTQLSDLINLNGGTPFQYGVRDNSSTEDGDNVKELSHATCSFCGLTCNDLVIEVKGDSIVSVVNGCSIGVSKFLNYHRNRILNPLIRDPNGSFIEVDFDIAIERAVEILTNAKHPLIYGLSNICNEAIEILVELAKVLGATIDSTASVCHGPTVLGLSHIDVPRITLEDVKDVDTVVIWGANPLEAHIKLFTSYINSKKRIIAIDVRYTETLRYSHMAIVIKPGRDIELIRSIRLILKGFEIEDKEVAGLPRDTVYSLVDVLRNAKRGVFFIGMGLTMTRASFANIVELLNLVKELNRYGKWSLLPLRGRYNVTGTNVILREATGYPFGVDFSSGTPSMFPGVTTAVDLLTNGDVDAALIIGSDPVAHLPKKAVEKLLRIPIVTIDCRWSLTASLSDVVIPTGITGIECGGTAYRLDEVVIELKKVINPPKDIRCDVEIV